MSHDPHAPTPAGPDPDEPTEIRPPADPTPLAGDDPTEPVETLEPTVGPAPEDDWLTPDPVAAPAPDPFLSTPSAFTPPGTPEPGTPEPGADGVVAQAQALTDRPEVMVALAFAGGVLVSLVLKRFGR